MHARVLTTLDSNVQLLDLVALVRVEAQLGAGQNGETNGGSGDVN